MVKKCAPYGIMKPIHKRPTIMSFFDYALQRVGLVANMTVTCPICGHKSIQSTTKVRQQQALLCPECKSLFVIHR
ncbi:MULTISPECIES: YnfU family zinc-binding protein [Enterobacter cloacae complex]|nr:YnfU family zinc-binding protein [Enterobacter ludwigii]